MEFLIKFSIFVTLFLSLILGFLYNSYLKSKKEKIVPPNKWVPKAKLFILMGLLPFMGEAQDTITRVQFDYGVTPRTLYISDDSTYLQKLIVPRQIVTWNMVKERNKTIDHLYQLDSQYIHLIKPGFFKVTKTTQIYCGFDRHETKEITYFKVIPIEGEKNVEAEEDGVDINTAVNLDESIGPHDWIQIFNLKGEKIWQGTEWRGELQPSGVYRYRVLQNCKTYEGNLILTQPDTDL